jgi:hypothetical protein
LPARETRRRRNRGQFDEGAIGNAARDERRLGVGRAPVDHEHRLSFSAQRYEEVSNTIGARFRRDCEALRSVAGMLPDSDIERHGARRNLAGCITPGQCPRARHRYRRDRWRKRPRNCRPEHKWSAFLRWSHTSAVGARLDEQERLSQNCLVRRKRSLTWGCEPLIQAAGRVVRPSAVDLWPPL